MRCITYYLPYVTSDEINEYLAECMGFVTYNDMILSTNHSSVEEFKKACLEKKLNDYCKSVKSAKIIR